MFQFINVEARERESIDGFVLFPLLSHVLLGKKLRKLQACSMTIFSRAFSSLISPLMVDTYKHT
jgi:hypothetical protein